LREYDAVIGRWTATDPDGGFDWYMNDSSGELEWINGSAEVNGFTYLGEDLTFNFSSFIDRADWNGPNPWFDPSGEKLFSSVTLDFSQDENGNLIGLDNVKYKSEIMTNKGGFKGVAWNSLGHYGIGAGGRGGNNSSYVAGFEKHAGGPFFETMGLLARGYMRVNVAQKLSIDGGNGKLTYKTFTDSFPSASLDINGLKVMGYRQPSFGTHRFWNYTLPHFYERQGISFKRGGN